MDQKLYEALQAIARQSTTESYQGLKARLGLPGRIDMRKLFASLGKISENEVRQGRPLLSVVIVQSDTGRPGPGFFRMARKLGVQRGQDDEAFFRGELKRAHECWGADQGRKRQAWIVRPFPHKIRRVDEFIKLRSRPERPSTTFVKSSRWPSPFSSKISQRSLRGFPIYYAAWPS